MPTSIIVIPCFDEADRLDVETFRRYVAETPDVDLLFVDDGSRDATRSVLDGLAASAGERITVMSLEANCGKAEAVRRGMLAALERTPDFVGFWDADLATPLDQIVRFRDVLAGNDDLEAVFGSRVNLLGHDVRRGALRHYLGRVFATAVAVTIGLEIYDSQCGAKLFRAGPTLSSMLAEPFLSRWIFDVELIARLARARHAKSGPPLRRVIFEQPLMRWHDVAGSKLRPRHFVIGAIDLLRIRRRYARYCRRER